MKRQFFSPAGANLYAIIRKRSNGQVWNGSAWEAWNNSNITTYDVAATDHGGGYYTFTVPAGIDWDGDLYDCQIRKRAGVDPAITDIAITSFPLFREEDFLTGDFFIDTGQTPWQIVIREQGTSTALITKNLYQTDGTNVTASTHVVGRHTQP